MNVDLNAKIPNNVGLADDKKLQKALEAWQPDFVQWWKDMGPEGFQLDKIYLRTAVSVGAEGWAHFDYVTMPEYRWGIFLTPNDAERTIPFGDLEGKPAWQDVPGEWRKELRRIIVTQGDTEPASVEQQRMLGKSAPSLYDLRNLFQVNVEEGRHLWAMVYLLHKYFGKDGREEADDLLVRRSGNPDSPRILGAFNEPISDWLSFFCFTMFTDRDGKYQLASLAESGFDPLSRSCRFMLTEEAHHMFVGETGVGRVIDRTLELMKIAPGGDVCSLGGIPLDLVQKWVNRWYSVSMDLFGGEDSSNAATYFAGGLKGRFKETYKDWYTDHKALEGSWVLERPGVSAGEVLKEEIPLRRAMNLVLRSQYTEDCQRAVDRWNEQIKRAGVDFTILLPSDRFNRRMGVWASMPFDPSGAFIGPELWDRTQGTFLPTKGDEAYVMGLMKPCYEPGKIASWLAPPKRGIHNQGFDFEYVRFEGDPYTR